MRKLLGEKRQCRLLRGALKVILKTCVKCKGEWWFKAIKEWLVNRRSRSYFKNNLKKMEEKSKIISKSKQSFRSAIQVRQVAQAG